MYCALTAQRKHQFPHPLILLSRVATCPSIATFPLSSIYSISGKYKNEIPLCNGTRLAHKLVSHSTVSGKS